MPSKPYYSYFICTSPLAAVWVCGLVDQLTGEPVTTAPTDRLLPLVPANGPADAEATAWMGAIALGPETYATLDMLTIPTDVWYVICDQTDPERYEILRTNYPGGQAFIGLAWVGESTDQAIGMFGLQRRVIDDKVV